MSPHGFHSSLSSSLQFLLFKGLLYTTLCHHISSLIILMKRESHGRVKLQHAALFLLLPRSSKHAVRRPFLRLMCLETLWWMWATTINWSCPRSRPTTLTMASTSLGRRPPEGSATVETLLIFLVRKSLSIVITTLTSSSIDLLRLLVRISKQWWVWINNSYQWWSKVIWQYVVHFWEGRLDDGSFPFVWSLNSYSLTLILPLYWLVLGRKQLFRHHLFITQILRTQHATCWLDQGAIFLRSIQNIFSEF